MSFDRRMRDAMRRISDTSDLDVETRLERTIEQSVTPRAGLPMGMVLATVLAVLVIAISVPALGGLVGPGVGASPTLPLATTSPAVSIAGAYTTTLAADVADPEGAGLAGVWTMTLGSGLTIDVTPPPDFTGSHATGHAYAIEGDTFETDLWFNDICDSIGRYRWSLTGDVLTLVVSDDPCETRRTVLATQPWDVQP